VASQLQPRIPATLFLVDIIGHEHIALAEAKRLNITTFGMVDTNCDPIKWSLQFLQMMMQPESIAIIDPTISLQQLQKVWQTFNRKRY
jgi:small subunit ribosomal protein S2